MGEFGTVVVIAAIVVVAVIYFDGKNKRKRNG